MPQFEFIQPNHINEVLDAIEHNDGYDIVLWGGGTATTQLLKQKLISPSRIVDVKRLPELAGISKTADGGVSIGACVRIREIEQSELLKSMMPMVPETASWIGNVRVRNAATLGGHLVHADPAQDLPPLFLTLAAEIHLRSKRGSRIVPIQEFFLDIMETALEPDEMMTHIVIPNRSVGLRSAYVKYAPRSRDDYGTVGVGASLKLAADGSTVESVGIAVGGAGPTARRFQEAEQELLGQTLTDELCKRAGDIVAELVDPWDDGRGTADYKREMSRLWTARLLRNIKV